MTYVMSDIHGNLRRVEYVMKQIDLQPEDTLYVLGDVIDRYPDGIRILRRLMKMPNVQMLLGNHEYMMLNAIGYEYLKDNDKKRKLRFGQMALWYHNGGEVTHNYIKHIRKETRAEIFNYLIDLPVNIDVEVNGRKFKLVHGAPKEIYAYYKWDYHNPIECAVWHRLDDNDVDFDGFTIIFGHTPTEYFQECTPMSIWYSEDKKKIGIDCGCGYPSQGKNYSDNPMITRLGCLRLDDMKEFYSEDPEGDEENG